MLTLRPLPPSAQDHPDPVLNFYYGRLLSHWTFAQRGTATLIGHGLAGFQGPAACLRQGIEAKEWRLVEGRVDPAHYVSMRTRKGVHRLLNPAALPLRRSTLKDKRRFHAFTSDHALPAPDTCLDENALGPWLADQQRIVAKPNFSAKGKGVRLFERRASAWHDDAGGELDEAAMVALLRGVLTEGGIVQAALTTLPDLADVSPGALPTLRVVTFMDGQGAIEIASRVLRVGGGDAPVDNFNRGGIAASIESCGAIGARLRACQAGLADVARHPHNDAPFADSLPGGLLAEADTLAAAAHRALDTGHAIVGWDIGLTDQGPVLIEGNWNPGTDVMQLLTGRALSQQRAGALYLAALERVPDSAWRAAAPIQLDR